MSRSEPRRSISDSPWFWILIYSGWTFIALALLSAKYGARQSQLERQFQGRVHAEESKSGSTTAPEKGLDALPDASRNYSTPENTIIGLAPLAVIFGGIAFCAAVMLVRERWTLHRVGDSLTKSGHGDAVP
jgi:hypothetical protein